MIGLDFFKKIYSQESELTIFDVGAHHGDSIFEFLDLFPKARIFAFEPDRKNFLRLEDRFSGVGNVQLRNAAIGDKDGRALLHRNNYDATHSLLPFDPVEINRWADANDFVEEGVDEIDQVRLDTFCNLVGVKKIDILKLDIQGGEMLALQGAGKLLDQKLGCIFCEVEFRPLYQGQPLFWDISEFLMSRSYHFLNLVSPKVSEIGALSWADAIYLNEPIWRDIAEKHSAGNSHN